MIYIDIVNDNKSILGIVSSYIKTEVDFTQELFVSEYPSADELIKQIDGGKQIDIVFSDIEMPGLNGIELAKTIKQKRPRAYIVFLTSYVEFEAVNYEINVYQYILKSDMERRILGVLETIVDKLSKEKRQYRIVGTITDQRKIYYRDIVYFCKAKGNKYVEFIVNNEIYRERVSLDTVMKDINNKMFLIVGRSYVINMKHIVRVKGNEIYMDNGDVFSISRPRIAEVKEQINRYWREM